MQNGSKRRKTDATPTICVLGATGVGKGSTLNSCFRETKFGTSSLFASNTIKPASFVLPWRGTGEQQRQMATHRATPLWLTATGA